MNGDDDTAPAQAKAPIMAVVAIKAWGVDPGGTAAQILVQSATQEVALAFDFEQLVNLSVSVKAAIYQARKNQAELGKDMTQAVPIQSYGVGHATGVEGVLMAIDARTPSETIYVMNSTAAIDLGRQLVNEGMRLDKRTDVLNRAMPPKGKIILPGGGVH